MEKRLAGWAASSQDPATVSNKIRGSIIALSSVIIFIAAQFFQVSLTANDVISLATQLGTIAGLIWGLYGAGLQFVTWLATKTD